MTDINPFFDTNEGVLKAENFAQVFNMISTLAGEGVPLSTEMDKTIVFKIDHHNDTGVPKLMVSLEPAEDAGGFTKTTRGLPEDPGNPCIKTGCRALVGDSPDYPNRTWYGDLFRFGDYLLLNCNSGVETMMPENRSAATIHLFANSWNHALKNGTVILFHIDYVEFFSYDGLPGDHFDSKSS